MPFLFMVWRGRSPPVPSRLDSVPTDSVSDPPASFETMFRPPAHPGTVPPLRIILPVQASPTDSLPGLDSDDYCSDMEYTKL